MMIGLRSDPEATLFLRCSVLLYGAWFLEACPRDVCMYASTIVYRDGAYVISTER
jgi:hypothetical protein